MKTFEFTVIATGLDPNSDDFEDRLSNAGCDDATVSFQKGVIILEFARTAGSFANAVVSALKDVLRAGARPAHVEPDYLVSLSDIAARAGLTRGAVSLYAKGARGKDFPAPVARVTTESPLWDWVEVADWMYQQAKLSQESVIEAKVVRAANIAVQRASEAHGNGVSEDNLKKEIAQRKELADA